MDESVLIFLHNTQLHNTQKCQFHYRLKADFKLNTKLSEDAFCVLKKLSSACVRVRLAGTERQSVLRILRQQHHCSHSNNACLCESSMS